MDSTTPASKKQKVLAGTLAAVAVAALVVVIVLGVLYARCRRGAKDGMQVPRYADLTGYGVPAFAGSVLPYAGQYRDASVPDPDPAAAYDANGRMVPLSDIARFAPAGVVAGGRGFGEGSSASRAPWISDPRGGPAYFAAGAPPPCAL